MVTMVEAKAPGTKQSQAAPQPLFVQCASEKPSKDCP